MTSMRDALCAAGVLSPVTEREASRCRAKVRHETVEQALAQGHQLVHHRGQLIATVYRCPVCRDYHLSGSDREDAVACTSIVLRRPDER